MPKTITLTQKDIEKADIQNSESGMLIDELAYSAKQWTSEELYSNNLDYEPTEPYRFDFEADLLENTKTEKQIATLLKLLDSHALSGTTAVHGKQNLQAGAYYALNYPEHFDTLLKEYTQAVKEQDQNNTIISKKYAKELQEAKDDFHKDQYRDWLYGDHDYAGVLKEIAKYYGAISIGYDSKTETIKLSFEDNKTDNDELVTKKWLLSEIKEASDARAYKDKQDREKRKAERERLAIYKAEQAKKAEQERKERLLKLTL